MWQRIKKLWQLTANNPDVVTSSGSEQEPFVVFPCAECKQPIVLQQFIYPGDAAVIDCENCDTSMTVFSPQLLIKRTKELPTGVQEKVWSKLSE